MAKFTSNIDTLKRDTAFTHAAIDQGAMRSIHQADQLHALAQRSNGLGNVHTLAARINMFGLDPMHFARIQRFELNKTIDSSVESGDRDHG
jgi:hypothetical protein